MLLHFKDHLTRNHGVLESDVIVVATLTKLIVCAQLQALQDKLLHAWTSGKLNKCRRPWRELKGERTVERRTKCNNCFCQFQVNTFSPWHSHRTVAHLDQCDFALSPIELFCRDIYLALPYWLLLLLCCVLRRGVLIVIFSHVEVCTSTYLW